MVTRNTVKAFELKDWHLSVAFAVGSTLAAVFIINAIA